MKSGSLRWNLIANFGGQGWRAFMALVFVPFYVRILGVEAYGLIGLYASLQMALAILDAGLRPALAREMARFTGGAMDADAIRTLLRSIEVPLAGIAVTIIAIMAIFAPWLAQHWVNPDGIPRDAIAQAFAVMGLVAALQLIESAYDSCLAGLQRQVLQNAIITAAATLRGFGALAVLWAWPTVSAFFLWQAAVALLSLAALAYTAYRSLPQVTRPARFSLQSLLEIRGYALGMLGIAVVSLLLTQSDRLLLAKLMPLSEVGRYAIAASLAGAIAFLSSPVAAAYFPRLTELIERGEIEALTTTFHRASRLMTMLTGSAAAIFVLLGDKVLHLWLQDPGLAVHAAPLLALLALGCLFNALTALPYLLQLAHGLTALTLRINLAMLVFFIPALFFMVKAYGAWGAALCWAGLNIAGMSASAGLTFRRFLNGEGRRWFMGDILVPLAVAFAAAALARELLPWPTSPVGELAVLALSGIAILACGILADRQFRGMALQTFHRVRAGLV